MGPATATYLYNFEMDSSSKCDQLPEARPTKCLNEPSYSEFHPLEVVSRYRDPHLQVGENYMYLYRLNNVTF